MDRASVARLVLALVIGAGGSGGAMSGAGAQTPITKRATPPVLTQDNAVARVRLSLERVREPKLDPYAEWMSVGPLGAGAPQASGFFLEPPRRLLRVTISTNERVRWLTIDALLNGRAGSRRMMAQYHISPYFDERMHDLWQALMNAPRVMGPVPDPPIAWLSPTSFAWMASSDTLVFEQETDSVFMVTVRARVR